MAGLPPDVLRHVFSLVPAAELVQSVASVCHEWRSLASDPDVWRTRCLRVSLRPSRPLSAAERRVLRRAPSLRSLSLSLRRSQDLPAALSELLPACAHLRELHLTVPRLTAELLGDVRRHWPRLLELQVDATRIEEAAFEEMGRLEYLQRLRICSLQEPGSVWPGLARLSGCRNLRGLHLDVRCSGPADIGPETVVRALSDRLTDLHIGTLMPASDRLLATIGKCAKLRQLHVVDCSAVTDSGLERLSGEPVALSLESLSLQGASAVTPAGLLRLLHRSDLSLLREIRLPGCPALSEQVLRLLARRCSYLPRLAAEDCPYLSRRYYESLWGTTSGSFHTSVTSCGDALPICAPFNLPVQPAVPQVKVI